MAQERLLTTGEVADRFGVHPETVRIWCDSGMVAFRRVGVIRFIPESELASIDAKRAEKRAHRRSRCAAVREENGRLRTALVFAATQIKAGLPWTPECEEMIAPLLAGKGKQ